MNEEDTPILLNAVGSFRRPIVQVVGSDKSEGMGETAINFSA